ncbi:uncharacterized protein LOC121375303 [Gigantopelta aegis]|uniref:uncharacterized protein LOC121375303 n=1 Tax=Gigantopelta aegis TaxID=1735272 RepID=UPI001B88ACC4|nr:uncharacterized protein LOC121375303 [Gigantopelta aegis]
MPASCSFCSKQTNLLRCSACHVAVYCSKECQRKHWKSHKDQCKKIQEQTGAREGQNKSTKSHKTIDNHNDPRGTSSGSRSTETSKTFDNHNDPRTTTNSGSRSTETNKTFDNHNDPRTTTNSGSRSTETNSSKAKTPSSTPREQKCSSCKTFFKQGSGKPCPFCEETMYCSAECRSKDVKIHHDVCKTKDDMMFVKHSLTMSRSGVLQVNYVSPITISDLTDDGASGAAAGSSSTNGKESDSTKIEECRICKSRDARLKSCAKCSKVFYCSKECQRKDWPSHKKECLNIDGKIGTEEFKEQKKEEQHKKQAEKDDSRLQHLVDMVERMDQRSEHEMHFVPSQPCMSIADARVLARNHYPLLQIIENLRAISQESLFSTPRNNSTILLARISRYHPYKRRHAVHIEDSLGQETFVMFYFDDDDPEPYFYWNLVTPGNYLCFRGPFFHHFVDGTTGIRIDDPSEVFIIHKGLKRKTHLYIDHFNKMPASCSFCSKHQTNPLRCSACHVAVYCSKECQRKHWKSHKDQCKKIQKQTGALEGENKSTKSHKTVDNHNDPRGTSSGSRSTETNKTFDNLTDPRTTNSGSRSTEINSSKAKKTPSSTPREQKCPSCKTFFKQGSGKACPFCEETVYCSAECRSKDVKVHHDTCKTKDDMTFVKCSLTMSRSGGLQVNDVSPITVSDFTDDGASAAAGSNPTNGKESDSTKIEECRTCKSRDARLKSCAKCSKVFYCCKECQREDWPSHKKECLNLDGKIETEEFKKWKKEEERKKRAGTADPRLQHFIDMMEMIDQRSEHEMRFVPSQPCMSIADARVLARNHYPLLHIIENLRGIPQECLFFTPRDMSTVLLARISRYHPYKRRHAVHVEDSLGQETFVMFYFDNDPKPYFYWNLVIPGNYLCFRGPFFHHFLEGTTGIRVDDPSEVFIIHKGLKRYAGRSLRQAKFLVGSSHDPSENML